jgi:hydroxyacylglutathione hydrolase
MVYSVHLKFFNRSPMQTVQVETVPYYSDNYCYLIHHPGSGKTALVDCGDGRAIIKRLELKGWGLDLILIAHHHIDHTSGISMVRGAYPGARVYAPADGGLGPLSVVAADGDKIPLGPLEVEAVGVAFHTLGCTSYYVDGCLFVSDTLFSGGCGRLFEGTQENLERAMDRLAAFPPETRIYFGHEYTFDNLRFAATVENENRDIEEYARECKKRLGSGGVTTPTTLGRELKINPFLRIDEEAVTRFVDPAGRYTRTERLGLLRKAKDRF